MFSKFFIDRPIFATVISLLIVLAGGASIVFLPIDRYPEITPPTIRISAFYPGATAETVAKAVAGPIEEQLSGATNLIYYSSQSSNDGSLSITATFEIGTDQDLAAVEIQNRLSVAEPQLPAEVVRQGLTVRKASSNILGVATLESTDPRYDELFLNNYAQINLLDAIKRVSGVGDASVFGSKSYAMRIWVNPDRLSQLNMSFTDVANAIRDQNRVFPAGSIGLRPHTSEIDMTIPVLTSGQLTTEKQYRDIILRAYPDGRIVRLGDVSRIELGSQSYTNFGRISGKPCALIIINLQTGANALQTIKNVQDEINRFSQTLPEGIVCHIPFDTTTFIHDSIAEVITTLLEAVGLVLIVVFVFLQSWRATLIPLLAVPVAIIGTFAGMMLFGFSINTLTLFGMVLAIGIVVDDAIVVVENIERLMEEEHLSTYDATVKAMHQVSGALIAIVLVLTAVFVPVTFLGGLTGQMYRQFAVTIAVSVVISGFVALTLSPALCRILLKPSHGKKKLLPFRAFDWFFGGITAGYTAGVRAAVRFALASIVLFIGLGFITYQLKEAVPTGFLPVEDQGYFITAIQLPDGASLDRTDVVTRRVEDYLLHAPGIANVTTLGGVDLLSGFVNSSNAATMFCTLSPFDERIPKGLTLQKITGDAFAYFSQQHDAFILAITPPSISGLGRRAGFEMELEARSGQPVEDLAQVGQKFIQDASQRPELQSLQGTLRITVPQLFVNINRDKSKMLGVDISDVFDSLQAYLGSLYVNDFSEFGRVWRVQLQAESAYRNNPADIARIYVRNDQRNMVPLSAVTDTSFRAGPNLVSRFNGYPSIQITGVPGPGLSTGQAMQAINKVALSSLPPGYSFEWSGESYQEIKTGNMAPYVLGFGLVVIFLVLAAQYERWSIPIAVLLVVPFAILGALVAIKLSGLVQDIYFQVGLLVLVGLSVKNAILIIEFCASMRKSGLSIRDSAIRAARIRFRPIVMTSLAFIMGVLPLVYASGAGAAARHSIGTGVVGGMLFATFLAPFFVPVFFVVIETIAEGFARLRGRVLHHSPHSAETSALSPELT